MHWMRTMRKTLPALSLLLIASVTLLGACATMDTDVERPGAAYDWDVWDDDSNDALTEAEFEAGVTDSGVWVDWDSDNDGYVTEAEWDAGVARIDYDDAWGDFEAWDSDDDLRLSEDEWHTGVWHAWDVDGDGRIEQVEWNAGVEAWGWDT